MIEFRVIIILFVLNMTEYRTAIYKTQITQRTRTTIRRAFTAFGRGHDARFLESISRIFDLNSMVYACAYLIILDGINEEPKTIANSKLFGILVNKIGDPENEKTRLTLLFHVYVTIIMIRLNVPPNELLRREGYQRRFADVEDGMLV